MTGFLEHKHLNRSLKGAPVNTFLKKTALALMGITAISTAALAKDAPTKGQFEIQIVGDSTDSGYSERKVNVFKRQNHHEVKARATFVFTHTDANDSVAEGYKDASAAVDAKLNPLSGSTNKIKSSGLMSGGLMKMMEKCSELEDEDEIQSCMMKAAGGLQGQMQEKCTKDPSLCAAIEDMQDEDTVNGIESEARKLQDAMTKFRHYTSDSCTVDAAIDYSREDEFPSDAGGRMRSQESSKTNGMVRGVPSSGRQPCTLTVAVGPDNTMSFSLSLADSGGFPGTYVSGNNKTSSEKLKLQLGGRFSPYLVKKHKSVSGTSFSGEQTVSEPAKTVKESGGAWTVTSSAKTKINWSMKLD